MLELIYNYLPLWLNGIWTTIQLTLLSLIISLVLALFLAWIKLQHNRWMNLIIDGYLYLVRGTPFLIQLFLIYYGSTQTPLITQSWFGSILDNAFICGLIALIINATAYATSLFYCGLQNLNHGEIAGAQSMGLSSWHIFFYIMLPNLFYRIFPAYLNEMIMVLKCSALVSTVAILDITGSAQLIISDSYQSLPTLCIAALFYLCITIIMVIPLKLTYSKAFKKRF